jgi:NAD(P)-dependent dehydrogenase (short-subunit alcohol dehydrogenase family)
MGTYGHSKYANILFTQELQERFNKNGIDSKVVSIHPGGVVTEI